jgi:hypothetical protein
VASPNRCEDLISNSANIGCHDGSKLLSLRTYYIRRPRLASRREETDISHWPPLRPRSMSVVLSLSGRKADEDKKG